MIIKLILIATALIMVGCSVFPSNTSVSVVSDDDLTVAIFYSYVLRELLSEFTKAFLPKFNCSRLN